MYEPYRSKPFIKIVESFVMKAIGALDPGVESALQAMTPKLQQIYGRSGTWDQITREVLDLPAEAESDIRRLWEKHRTLAAQAGRALSPAEFTVAFVDKHIVGTPDSGPAA